MDFIGDTEHEKITSRGNPGETISQYRQAMGLSISELAEQVGMEERGAAAIEIGELLAFWPFDVTRLVCECLRVDCASFVRQTMW